MSIDIVYSRVFAPETDVWKFKHDGEQFLHLEVDKAPPLYGITWHTAVPTRTGLDAIRQSYARLKRAYIETKELEGLGRVLKHIDGGFAVGPVTFELEGYDAPSQSPSAARTGRTVAVEMPYFLNPDSFADDASGRNMLRWIRLNTEYLAYYLEGGAILRGQLSPYQSPGRSGFSLDVTVHGAMDMPRHPSRECGVLGDYRATDEIVRFFSETSSANLSASQLREVRQKLEAFLGTFPEFIRR